jgi:glycine/D-amino acid oxidase-like deaminating enzyme
MKATLAFYKRARDLGVTFFSGEPVIALKKIKGRARQVLTANGNVFEAETIVVAAGNGSRPIAESVGVTVPLLPYYIEALVTEMQPQMFDMMLGTADADFYGHQCEHGSFVFGSGTDLEAFLDREYPNDLRTDSITASHGCRAVMGYIPALKDAKNCTHMGRIYGRHSRSHTNRKFRGRGPGDDSRMRIQRTRFRSGPRDGPSDLSNGFGRRNICKSGRYEI